MQENQRGHFFVKQGVGLGHLLCEFMQPFVTDSMNLSYSFLHREPQKKLYMEVGRYSRSRSSTFVPVKSPYATSC